LLDVCPDLIDGCLIHVSDELSYGNYLLTSGGDHVKSCDAPRAHA